MSEIMKFKVSLEMLINMEDAKELVEEYGDPIEFADDPATTTADAIDCFLNDVDLDYLDITGPTNVNFMDGSND